MRVGFAGLGDLGSAIATRLLNRGVDLVVWNRSPDRAAALVAAGARAVASPAQLALECDVLLLCLTDASAAQAVLFGPGCLADAGGRCRLVVDHSTYSPADARALGARLASSGVDFLDAPVSGGAAGALSGSLAMMVGGAPDILARIHPLLSAYAGNISHMGAIGSGQAAKICNQIIIFATTAALAEAFATARANGIEPQALAAALEGGFADSNMLREYLRGRRTGDKPHMTNIVDGLADALSGAGPAPSAGLLHQALKDIRIAASLAPTNRHSPIATVRRLFERAGADPRPPGD